MHYDGLQWMIIPAKWLITMAATGKTKLSLIFLARELVAVIMTYEGPALVSESWSIYNGC